MNPSFRSSPCLSRRALGAGAVAALLASGTARAASLRVSIAEMPDPVVTESLVQAIRFAAAKVPGVSIEVTTTSFPRSIQNVIDGAADIHLPMIRVPHPETLAFDLSTAAMGIVPFVLYMNKNKPVDIALVRKGGKYEIESETASTGYWDFRLTRGAGLESSMKKVEVGRIDGVLFAGNVIDPFIQKFGLKQIRRAFFENMVFGGVIPKNGRGGPTDQWFSTAMAATRDDPEFQAIIRKSNHGYMGPDWQPS